MQILNDLVLSDLLGDRYDASAGESLNAQTLGLIEARTGPLEFIEDAVFRMDIAPGATSVILPRWPIVAVTSVEVLTDRVTDEWNLLDGNDWGWSDWGLVTFPPQYRGSRWDVTIVRVTADVGWQDCPPALMAVATSVAQRMTSTPAGVTAETIGGYSVQYGGTGAGVAVGALSDGERAIVARYDQGIHGR